MSIDLHKETSLEVRSELFTDNVSVLKMRRQHVTNVTRKLREPQGAVRERGTTMSGLNVRVPRCQKLQITASYGLAHDAL